MRKGNWQRRRKGKKREEELLNEPEVLVAIVLFSGH
jgi:hypothetical protein